MNFQGKEIEYLGNIAGKYLEQENYNSSIRFIYWTTLPVVSNYTVAIWRIKKREMIPKTFKQGDTVCADNGDEVLVSKWPIEGVYFSGVQVNDNSYTGWLFYSNNWVKSAFKIKQ